MILVIGIFLSVLFLAGLGILGASLYMRLRANHFIFNPHLSKDVGIPDGFRQEFFSVKEHTIESWLFTHPTSDYIALYIHGNRGRIPDMLDYLSRHLSVYAPTFPGFHQSSDTPLSEEIIQDIVQESLNQVKAQGYPSEKILIFGYSLGGTLATYLASQDSGLYKLMTLNSPSSIWSMCKRQYGPICILGRDLYRGDIYARQVTIPTEVYHAQDDDFVPPEESRILEKAFVQTQVIRTEIPQSTHSDIDYSYLNLPS